MRTKGKITFWNNEKGYGFITPSAGARQVFVHISAFRNRLEPPEVNQQVEFSLSTDKQGRPCAVRVAMAGGWPGALIAQQTLRHKSKKESFRFVFWLTVFLNGGVYAWLFTPSGAAFLGNILA